MQVDVPLSNMGMRLFVEGRQKLVRGTTSCAGEEEYQRVQAVLKDTDGVDKIIYLMRLPIEE